MVDKDKEICEDSVKAAPVKAMENKNVITNRHESSKLLVTDSSIDDCRVPYRPSVRMKLGQMIMGDVLPNNTSNFAGKELVSKQKSKISSTEIELEKGLYFFHTLSMINSLKSCICKAMQWKCLLKNIWKHLF